MPDQFGGIEIEEPKRDEFGGIPIDQTTPKLDKARTVEFGIRQPLSLFDKAYSMMTSPVVGGLSEESRNYLQNQRENLRQRLMGESTMQMGIPAVAKPEEYQAVAGVAGRELERQGKLGVAELADVGSLLTGQLKRSVAGTEGEPTSNIQAWIRNQELPAETQRRLLPPAARAGLAGAQGLVETAPRLAGVAGLQFAGVPAPVAAAAMFGLTKEGIDVKQAAIAAALPIIGKYTGAVSEALAGKLGVSSERALEIVNKIGGAAGATALLSADTLHQISNLPEDQRKDAFIDAIGNIAPMAILGLAGERLKPSELAEQIKKGKEYAQGIRTDTGQPETPGVRVSEGKTDSGGNVEQKAPEQPQPVAPREEAKAPEVTTPAETFEKETGVKFQGQIGGQPRPEGLTPEQQSKFDKANEPLWSFTELMDDGKGGQTAKVSFATKAGATIEEIREAWEAKKKAFEGTPTPGTEPATPATQTAAAAPPPPPVPPTTPEVPAGGTPPPPRPPDVGDVMDQASHPEASRFLPKGLVDWWRSFSMQSLPKITAANRQTGEAGVRMASAAPVAALKGEMFANRVIQSNDPSFDMKFGTALAEDNLRSVKAGHESEGATEAAGKVSSLIGQKNSPFKNEQEYQDFLKSPEFQAAVERHKAQWESEKDPLFRQANDLDPDVELATRGLQTGARINLKAIMPEEGGATTVGPAYRSSGLIRQAATLKRSDPFAKKATGGADSYEGSYTEIMKNGFGREYPVAKQHQFIKGLIDSGDAVLTDKEFPDIQVKGEGTKAYLMRLGPWRNRWLQVRKSLAPEYQAASGLDPAASFGMYTKAADFLTRQSVVGLAEGSTHVSNLASQVFTGLGPTGNPMLNALIKNAGRADVIYSLPKILINAFSDRKADMLHLMEIGAGKTPFPSGKLTAPMSWFITKMDQGSRLYARDVYKKMAANGWVPDTETGLREFVNQVGQYNKKLQPGWIRALRDTGFQPFATAMQTFNVGGLRTLGLGPGAKGTSKMAALAMRAEKASNLIGFAVLVGTLNYMVSGTATGPKGTKLGAVGWIGDDGKLHQFDIGALTGLSRGARITGIQPAIEAKRLGLSDNEAINAGAQGAANTIISAAAGPMNRALFTAATGKRPGLPAVQEAPVVPPTDELAPLKSQAAANIMQAAQQANPAIDFTVRMAQGKPGEAVTRQLSRYTPKTGLSTETIEALPRITKLSQVNAYADALAKEARKIPQTDRGKFIMDRLDADKLTGEMRGRALLELRRKGAWQYP